MTTPPDMPEPWVVRDYDQDGYLGTEPHPRRASCVNPRPAAHITSNTQLEEDK